MVMKCKKCGEVVNKKEKFCKKCGEPIKKQISWPLELLIGLLVGVLIYCLFLVGLSFYASYEMQRWNSDYDHKYIEYMQNIADMAKENQNIQKSNEIVLDENCITTYADGDSIYIPPDSTIAYNEEQNIYYYNNLLIVWLVNEVSDEEAKQIANSVGGVVAGHANKQLQIVVPACSLEQLETYAAMLMKIEKVWRANYDHYPMLPGID